MGITVSTELINNQHAPNHGRRSYHPRRSRGDNSRGNRGNNGGNKRRGQRIDFCILMRSTPTGQIQNIMVFLSSLQQKNIRISEDKNRKSTNSFYPKKPITIDNLQKCADDNTTMSFGSIKN